MSDDDSVVPIGVEFKAPIEDDLAEGPVLRVLSFDGGCNHQWRFEGDPLAGGSRIRDAHYRIRAGATEVECGLCGDRLDPVWVLVQLAAQESKWRRTREAYQDEMKRLRSRQRTKCRNCGHMTPISHK